MTGPPDVASVEVDQDAAGSRLDVFLAGQIGQVSRSSVQALIGSGKVLLNGVPARASTRLRPRDVVEFPSTGPAVTAPPSPENIPLSVIYEDTDLLVIEKPPGMVVHPSPGHSSGTLVNALLARYPDIGTEGGQRPGIVHRLDKDTSGLILVGRNALSTQYLQDQLREHKVLKEYTLLCCGVLQPPTGRIEGPIGRDPRNPLRMGIASSGRAAVTSYETLAVRDNRSLVLARLHTGRTHQIRVHFSSVGHAIAGDSIYGRCEVPGLHRQFLHASRLALTFSDGRQMEWSSRLPDDLRLTLDRLQFDQ